MNKTINANIKLSIFTLIGLILIAIALIKKNNSNESFNYEETNGIITTYDIDLFFDNTLYGVEVKNMYKIFYKYKVNNQEFYSSTISYDSKVEVKNVPKYSLGMEIKVYYNKNNPAEAVLIPGIYNLYTSYFFVVGLFCFVTGVVLLLVNFKYRKEV